jgi:hypothetical protein
VLDYADTQDKTFSQRGKSPPCGAKVNSSNLTITSEDLNMADQRRHTIN